MAYSIKAWVVVCFLIFIAHRFLKPTFTPALLEKSDFDRIFFVWLGLTAAVFLSFNFWILLAIAAGVMISASKRMDRALLLCAIMFCSPYHEKVVPGVGAINYFASLSYPRILMLAFLLAQSIANQKKQESTDTKWGFFDSAIVGIGILNFTLAYRGDTLTNSMRVLIYHALDVFCIYWIGRQYFRNNSLTQKYLSGFTYGIAIIAAISIFEAGRKWLLYAHTDSALGASGVGVFLLRGDTGLLRSYATTSHPLALGYVTALGTLVWLSVAQSTAMPLKQSWRPLVLIVAGLLATVSRGPWLCLAAAFLVWLLVQPRGIALLGRTAVITALAAGGLMLTPMGDSIIELLPFVGSVETGNIDYRKQLVEVSWLVVMENPFFGSNTFMYAPIMQQLIQGQGIIDLVNHYVATALSTGFVGVSLFMAAHIGPALLGIHRVFTLRHLEASVTISPDLRSDIALLRGLSCALLASAMALATTSAITVIPWTCWLLTGACVTVLARVRAQTTEGHRPSLKAVAT
jgi:O-Antigen ligase